MACPRILGYTLGSMASVKRLRQSDLLDTESLQKEEIVFLLEAATRLKATKNPPTLLQGRTVANLFFEDSTRTRTSFEMATRRLGGSPSNFSAGASSLSKGESLLDTAKTIAAMQPDCLVVRHRSAGSPAILAKHLEIPIVNAGDGFHEHPTQALLDALTIQEHVGKFEGLDIVIVGDIAHSRVARSNIHLLKKLGAKITICGPPTLLPPSPETLGVESSFHLDELLPTADIVMTWRIQLERQNRMQIPTAAEYTRFWGITQERVKKLKPKAIIMHPGPMVRGVEIASEVADDSRCLVLDQVANGVSTRMAVLAACCAPERLEEFLNG